MALELTPEIQNAASPLAGGDSAIPAAVLTPPIVAPQIPAIGAPQDQGGQNALGDYGQQGGISEGFASQFAKAADRLGIPAGPGGWAKSIIGASMNALANVGSIGKVPEGAGALYGVGKVLEAQRAQASARQERQDKLQQQAFENNLKMSREQREQQAFQADNLIRQYQIENWRRNFDTAERKELAESGQHWQETREKAGDTPIPGLASVTGEQAKKYIAENKVAAVFGKDTHIVGWQDHIGPDGLPSKDKNGKVIQEPLYTFLQPGGPREVSKENAADFKKWVPQLGYTEGTALNAEQFANGVAQVEKAKNEYRIGLKVQDELGLEEKRADELKDSQARKDADSAIAPYMALPGIGMDPKKALEEISKEAASVDANGQPTPTAQKAQDALDKLNRGYGAQVVSDYFGGQEKIRQEEIKDKAKESKDAMKKPRGDFDLEGQDYINSLNPQDRGLVTMLGSGRGDPGRMAVMLKTQEGQALLDMVAHAYPGFNTSKIAGYAETVKDFDTKKTADRIQSLNVLLQHMDRALTHLNANPSAGVYGLGTLESKLAVKSAAQFKTAKGQAEQELASAYARGAVTDQEHREYKDLLDTATPMEFRNKAQEVSELLEGQINGFVDRWNKAAPSESYKESRKILSPEAEVALQRIREGDHKDWGGYNNLNDMIAAQNPNTSGVPKPVAPTSNQGFSIMAPDGKTQLTFPTQAALDQFKTAHGIK